VNTRRPNSPESAISGLSRETEARLIAAAARVFRTGFPNAERSGCPPREALKAVARKRPTVETDGVLEHLTCCSPCFAQYEQFLANERSSKSLRLLALCASVVLTVGLAVWFFASRTAPILPEPQIAKPITPPPPPKIEYQLASIDLRNRAPVRGEQSATADAVVATLRRQPLDLRVYLPVGSESGDYHFQIGREAAAPIISTSGTAKLENRSVILRIQADLRDLAPGRYILGIRKGSFRWMYYPLTVAD
jgi:hypothetical protein